MPVFQFMKENMNQYHENPLITQLAPRNVTYTHAQYMRRKDAEQSRPWLVGEENKLTALAKVQKLKNYLDELCKSKDKSHKVKVPYPYFIHKISEDTWGLSITCTDIFGIKMYLKHAKDGVIGIDATSVGMHEGKHIYWYAITVDMKGFERSDKEKNGMISVFDFFCVGKAQTSIPMITSAIEKLK